MSDSQKFLSKNRAPKVQIEYDVELYGAEKTVQLPFAMGVMADLSGHSNKPDVSSREFLEIDADNFDARMSAIAPSIDVTVPNTLTGEGNLQVGLAFSSMNDFSPEAIAANVPALRPLLEARQQLSHLMAYADGKAGAEALLEKLLGDPALLNSLASKNAEAVDHEAVLEELRAQEPPEPSGDDAERILKSLPPASDESLPLAVSADDVLNNLSADEHDSADTELPDDVLARVREEAPGVEAVANDANEILDALPRIETDQIAENDIEEAFASLADVDAERETQAVEDILSDIEPVEIELSVDASQTDILAELVDEALSESPREDDNALEEIELEELDVDLDFDSGELGTIGDSGKSPEISQTPFGRISKNKPERRTPNTKFRIAIFGDFSGRAARGELETGDSIASRRAIGLDIDNLDDVISGFATTLSLPLGKDGERVSISVSELDDLHPDELYENVAILSELASLRQQVTVPSMADNVRAQLLKWSTENGRSLKLPKRSAAVQVPGTLKLSEFQSLIGGRIDRQQEPDAIEGLIAQIVGPHAQMGPDADAEALRGVIDESIGDAMRLMLHHPDFQALEAQWRSLDFLARRVETDGTLDLTLYDISAEELAADLAGSEDLVESGIFKLLQNNIEEDEPFSAVFGLYTFEETPPHAELLARIAKIAAFAEAPFVAAISPAYLETPKAERHKLVASSWDSLAALSEANYLGLVSPRFLLRQPYGKRSDPIDAFEFEEFTKQEGLSGMLWANPVILVATLMARSFRKNGQSLELGSVMSEGDIPFHFVSDRYGDQVALPCTERNLTSDPAQMTLARGFMPVVWMKGRNEVRLGSFRSVGGEELAGVWSRAPQANAEKEINAPEIEIEFAAEIDDIQTDQNISEINDLDDLLAELTDESGSVDVEFEQDDEIQLDLDDEITLTDDDLADLDAILAEFGEVGEEPSDDINLDGDDKMDPELAALLESL